MVTEVARRHFTVEEYHRMVQVGILRDSDRVELIDGEIIQMSAMGYLHWGSVARASRLLMKKLDERTVVAIQLPVKLDEWSEPLPDVAIFKPSADFYVGKQGPGPEDVLLLIEIADSSLPYDRNTKRIKYARSQMPEYWIVDLTNEQLLVFRDPRVDDYATSITLRRGESIAPLAFPDVTIAVNDLLGDPETRTA